MSDGLFLGNVVIEVENQRSAIGHGGTAFTEADGGKDKNHACQDCQDKAGEDSDKELFHSVSVKLSFRIAPYASPPPSWLTWSQ